MEGGIFLCHWYFLLKSFLRRTRQEASQIGAEISEMTKSEETAEAGSEALHKSNILSPITGPTSQENV